MKKQISGIFALSYNFISILSIAFTGLLFITGLFFTCYAEDMVTQEVLTKWNHPVFHVIGVLALGGWVLFLAKKALLHPKKGRTLLLAAAFLVITGFGMLLVLLGRTAPAADAWSVYAAAKSAAIGDLSIIHPTESYLSYYPQQVGLLGFFELIIRLWNLTGFSVEPYHFIKCLYVLLTCVIVYYQSKTVGFLFDEKAECIYLLLAMTNLPLIMYSSFVYGEIPSFAALSAGLYYLMKLIRSADEAAEQTTSQAAEQAASQAAARTGKRLYIYSFVSLVCFIISVILRKNSLVIIIAVVLVLMLEGYRLLRAQAGLQKRAAALFSLAVLCGVLSVTILPAIQRVYEWRADNTLSQGVPAMSYFCMGMQESSRANGWYNGFNFNTYHETGMDNAKTTEISRAQISKRLIVFREHPGYALSFYTGKYLSQWADGTYASRQATLATLGERHPAAESLYTGQAAVLYILFDNWHQALVYFGCFLFALFHKRLLGREKGRLYPFTLLIGAFGGFLFHMLWEANARYIFPYSLLLMPYAAAGLSFLSSTSFLRKSGRNNTGRTANDSQTPPTEG